MMIKIIKITPQQPDERGLAYAFSTRNSSFFNVLKRKKGSISGKHYHKGFSKSKSPEILYLIEGKAKMFVKEVESGIIEEFFIEENNLIKIPAWIYHEVHAITDIIFLEIYIEESDFKKDTYYLKF